jgi:STE24 endopeptidase
MATQSLLAPNISGPAGPHRSSQPGSPQVTNTHNEMTGQASVENSEKDSFTPARAKAYNRTKLISGITSSVLSFGLIVLFVVGRFSRDLEQWVRSYASNDYVALLLFALCLGLLQLLITLPMGFYSGFVIEHRYNLSNQSFGRWAWERLKGTLVSLPIVIAVLFLLFFCLATYRELWWLPVSICLTFLSVVLARIAPILLLPLFYKFTPLEDGSLKNRILRLCDETGLRVNGVFSFNLSKNTKKANAGFTGIGKSKRIILGDTLVKEFSEEEIETVFAHELGHYKYRHIVIGILASVISTFAGLFITARLYQWSVVWLGFGSVSELAALPLLAIWLSLFGLVTSPIGNMISRRHERQADAYAVRATGNKAAFLGALRKLASMNLADPEPHPLIEFLFYSHPSISRRIEGVESIGS